MKTFEADDDEAPAGTVRDSLIWLIKRMARKWGDPRYAAMMRRVAADGTVQPQLYRDARDRLIGPHIERMNNLRCFGANGVDGRGMIRAWSRTSNSLRHLPQSRRSWPRP